MKLSFLFTSSLFVASAIATADIESSTITTEVEDQEDRELQVSHDDPNDYFNFYSDADDWSRCGIINVTDGCIPTVSIEEAACRAELIVWGRIVDENSKGDRKISVEWRSYVHDEPKLTVAKWGAGLDNSREANTTFSNDSGEFHTWVTGFSTDGCGTRPPLDGDSAYFFLEGLPENVGKEVAFESEFLKDLNVNFKLVTTAFGSGIAYGEDWQYIKKYRYGTQGCDRIACCYKPGCASCAEYDPTKCEYTTYVPPSGAASLSLVAGLAMMMGLAAATL